MAEADPKNTHSIAPIQEVADALARYVEENSDAQETPTPPANKHLDDLEHILCAFAKGRNLDDRKLQAKVIRAKLVRRIGYRRSDYARWLHYGHFVDENSDLRLCYLIRLTSNQLKIGQRRGSKSRTAAIKNINQLDVVERRAFDIYKGARRKPRKNLIERRAIQLVKAVENEWFKRRQKGRPEGKWTRKPDVKAWLSKDPKDRSFKDLKPLLTPTDLVLIAAPIIEEFAGTKILQGNAFTALMHIVFAYAEVITREPSQRELRISEKAIQQALSRARSDPRYRT